MICNHCNSKQTTKHGLCYYCGEIPMSYPSAPYSVPGYLFDWLVDYALETKGNWEWKNGENPSLQREYDRVVKHCEEAVKLRDTPFKAEIEL